MEAAGASLEPPGLLSLRALIAGGPTLDPDSLIALLIQGDLVEEANEVIRTARHVAADVEALGMLGSRIAPLASRARQRRSASWQLDSRRTSVRLHFAKEGEALGFDDGDLHALFLQAFRLGGWRLALDLGKRPRPLLSIGLPLPAGVGGQSELLDIVLNREPQDSSLDLMARLNQRLPKGLRVHQWAPLPGYASGAGELAALSHWRWEPTQEDRGHAEARLATFLAAQTWPWERGSSKAGGTLDLRHIIQDLHWEGGALLFSTRMGAFLALNPVKALSAVLELDPSCFLGLQRTAVDLRPDPRLGQADRFEPKLKNMYEDAVLLGGGSNLVLVDEDDDEPIILGFHPHQFDSAATARPRRPC